jgi:hypothetical protein
MTYNVYRMITEQNHLTCDHFLVASVVKTTFVQYIDLVKKVTSWAHERAFSWETPLISMKEYREIQAWLAKITDRDGLSVNRLLSESGSVTVVVTGIINQILDRFNRKADVVLEFFGEEINRRMTLEPAAGGTDVHEMMVGLTRLIQILLDLLAIEVHETDGQAIIQNQHSGRVAWFPINSVDDLKSLHRRFG